MSRALLDATVTIPADVIFRDLEGEAIILNLASGVYFGLNEVGSRIWVALAESQSVRRAVDEVVAQFEVERDVAERDVAELVAELVQRGLIQIPPAGDRP